MIDYLLRFTKLIDMFDTLLNITLFLLVCLLALRLSINIKHSCLFFHWLPILTDFLKFQPAPRLFWPTPSPFIRHQRVLMKKEQVKSAVVWRIKRYSFDKIFVTDEYFILSMYFVVVAVFFFFNLLPSRRQRHWYSKFFAVAHLIQVNLCK